MSESTVSTEIVSLPSDQDHTGRTLGEEEILFLRQAIQSGTLTSTKGSFVKRLEKEFASEIGVKHCYACSSGTAAIHTAVAALDLEPGDEVITTPITDMGALTPIVYQGGIPVFADVDAKTYNLTADTIERRLSERTRAIVVTHLFGNPCSMHEILDLAAAHRVPVIEDSAQAYLTQFGGRMVGSLGAIGCFSLQQGKHITTGEGGLLTTDDDDLARRMFLFINKAWGYGDANPDHYFLALNYRMNELQGAVACAQLPKLASAVATRIRLADELTLRLSGARGIATPLVTPGGVHTYWKYCLRVDSDVIEGGTVALGEQLRKRGIFAAPRYIQKPAFRCQVFRDQKTFGRSRFPFTLARPEAVDYEAAHYPGAFEALRDVLVLPWNERYEDHHVDYLATSILEAATQLAR